ncbi:MAG: putative chromosome partitioning ATPase ParA [Firmicutes bacterium]|nr:putative chromosome partitioning ATPase ParA [Ignavibacteriaceae bacterium]MBP2629503.1 putative chromosome partitioning ATPase ParA [Bacillota bacterium]
MKTISFINLKGGVGKTTISTNAAYALAESWEARVLFIDNDKQGNASAWFNASSDGTLTNILLDGVSAREVIQKTRYPNIDVISSDMGLVDANLAVLKDDMIKQDDILKKALEAVQDQYDICIIDNPPDMNISVLNALVVTDDVIIVTTPDAYSLQGVYKMADEIKKARIFNASLSIRGVLLNKFASTKNGYIYIDELKKNFPVFAQKIRFTQDRLDATTTEKRSIYETSPGCGFARDLIKFVEKLVG